jgi:hypothetical protein
MTSARRFGLMPVACLGGAAGTGWGNDGIVVRRVRALS